MADTMQFDLVTPERKLAYFQATQVEFPGVEGDMVAMPGHMPVITTLRPGILRAKGGADGLESFVVNGGFVEVNGEAVTVLAERAVPIEEATGTIIDEMIQEARKLAEAALPEDRDQAEKLRHDILMLRGTHAI